MLNPTANLIRAGLFAASLLSGAAMVPAAASAQGWYGPGGNHLVTRCDSDGDRCATFRCDPGGDACDRISRWRTVHRYGWNRPSYGYGYSYGRTTTRCDSDGDRCATFRCDWNGGRCVRIGRWRARW